MTSATDSDIREIKSAIDTIARSTEANTKAIADLTTSVTGLREEMRSGFADIREEMRVGFANVEGRINGLDGKVTTLTATVSNLDGRLWSFGLTILVAVLGALLTIFGRYIFTGLPIVQ